MRILLVSNMYPSPENPGYGVFVKNFAESLEVQGASLDYAVIRGRGKSRIDKLFKYFVFSCRVFFLALFRRYDCIYVHYIAHSLITLVPVLKVKNVMLVCNAHGEDLLPRTNAEKLIYRFVRQAVSRSSLLVVPSAYFAEVAQGIFPMCKVFVSPSAGVDLSIFKPPLTLPDSNEGKSLHVGFVSRIDPGKGWDVLLRGVQQVQKLCPTMDLKVSVVGEGSQAQALACLIDELELSGVVSHLGAMPQEELPKLYSSLDVFIFPTVLPESLGLVGLEALACGVPAICSDIGGIKSYMREGGNGYLFTPGDFHSLAQKIIHFSGLSRDEVQALRTAAVGTAQYYEKARVSSALYSKLVEVVKN